MTWYPKPIVFQYFTSSSSALSLRLVHHFSHTSALLRPAKSWRVVILALLGYLWTWQALCAHSFSLSLLVSLYVSLSDNLTECFPILCPARSGVCTSIVLTPPSMHLSSPILQPVSFVGHLDSRPDFAWTPYMPHCCAVPCALQCSAVKHPSGCRNGNEECHSAIARHTIRCSASMRVNSP